MGKWKKTKISGFLNICYINAVTRCISSPQICDHSVSHLPSGGLEELAVARRLPKAYSTGFVGCIKDVVVDGMELHLVEDALNSPHILQCSAAK